MNILENAGSSGIRRRKDLETGLTLATFDCYHNSSKDGPDWIKALEPL
jgi:hypothetical protein